MGKPVVASDTFGLKELIDHEQTGLLFENENDSELAEQVLRFLKDVRLSEKCVLNASQKALTKFDYPIFVQNISCLYHLDS